MGTFGEANAVRLSGAVWGLLGWCGLFGQTDFETESQQQQGKTGWKDHRCPFCALGTTVGPFWFLEKPRPTVGVLRHPYYTRRCSLGRIAGVLRFEKRRAAP